MLANILLTHKRYEDVVREVYEKASVITLHEGRFYTTKEVFDKIISAFKERKIPYIYIRKVSLPDIYVETINSFLECYFRHNPTAAIKLGIESLEDVFYLIYPEMGEEDPPEEGGMKAHKIHLKIVGAEDKIVEIGPGLAEEVKEQLRGKTLRVGEVLEVETPIGKIKVKVAKIEGSPEEEETKVTEETEVKLEPLKRMAVEAVMVMGDVIDWLKKEIVGLEEIRDKERIKEILKTTKSYTRIDTKDKIHYFTPSYRIRDGAVSFAPTIIYDEKHGTIYKVTSKEKTYTIALPLSKVEIIEDPVEPSDVKAVAFLVAFLGGLYVLRRITPKRLEMLWYEYIRKKRPPY